MFLGNRYAYAVASALHGVGNILHKDFMIQVWSSVNYIMWPSISGSCAVLFLDDNLILFSLFSHLGTWKLVMLLLYIILMGVIMTWRYVIHIVMQNFRESDSWFCSYSMFFFCTRVSRLMAKLENGDLTRDLTRINLRLEICHYRQMVCPKVWYGSALFANIWHFCFNICVPFHSDVKQCSLAI